MSSALGYCGKSVFPDDRAFLYIGEKNMEPKSNRIYAEMPPVRLFFHAALPGVVSMFSMSISPLLLCK